MKNWPHQVKPPQDLTFLSKTGTSSDYRLQRVWPSHSNTVWLPNPVQLSRGQAWSVDRDSPEYKEVCVTLLSAFLHVAKQKTPSESCDATKCNVVGFPISMLGQAAPTVSSASTHSTGSEWSPRL